MPKMYEGPIVLDDKIYFDEKKIAKLAGRSHAAEALHKTRPLWEKGLLFFAPVQVGEVEWDNNPKRRLPLYLFRHDGHVGRAYPNGFPNHNERLICHCGHVHYLGFAMRTLRRLGLRKDPMKRPPGPVEVVEV